MKVSGVIERQCEGVGVLSPDGMESVLRGIENKFGIWTDLSDYACLFREREKSLEGKELWLSRELYKMTEEAIRKGWERCEGVEMKYSMERSACSVCNKQRRLVGFEMRVSRGCESVDNNEFISSELVRIAKLLVSD